MSRMRMMCIDYCSLTTAPRTRIFIQQRNDKWIKRKTHVRPGLHAVWLRYHGSIGQVGVDRLYCITIHELGFHLLGSSMCTRWTMYTMYELQSSLIRPQSNLGIMHRIQRAVTQSERRSYMGSIFTELDMSRLLCMRSSSFLPN